MFLGHLFQKVFSKFWSFNYHGSGKWELLALYGHKEILQILLLWNCQKEIAYGPIENSGERSRAILALWFRIQSDITMVWVFLKFAIEEY